MEKTILTIAVATAMSLTAVQTASAAFAAKVCATENITNEEVSRKIDASVLDNGSKTGTTAQTDTISSKVEIGEVTVVGQRKLAKATDTGLLYDMKHDKAARGMNLLEALRRVPLVTVGSNGEIKVSGNSRYSIYLNGRPYRIAQSSPKETLEAIPAATIDKIEVVTLLDGRYDAEAGDAVINIIMVKNALDGYSLSLNGGGYTQPKAETGTMLMANKGKVNLSAGYNYDLNVQQNQPYYADYEYFGEDGSTVKTARMEGNGDGRWTNHLVRMMVDWMPDSLNSLYVDGHALINGKNEKAEIKSSMSRVSGSLSKVHGGIWQGTAETNLIYRNYYAGVRNQDRMTLGYRFTYNPDKRLQDYDFYPDNSVDDCLRRRTNTDGHLLEHTFSVDYALPIGNGHVLRIGAKEVLRKGDIKSEYLQLNGESWIPIAYEGFSYNGGLNYTQNVSSLYASYSGRIKKVLMSVSLRGEYNHNAFELSGTGESTSSNFTSLIPRLSLNYSISQSSRLAISYNSPVARPAIAQLNPFASYNGLIQGSQGNHKLNPSRAHSLAAQFSHYAGKLYLQASLAASRENDAILQNYTVDKERELVLERYGNFGSHDQMNASLYANYRPNSWLSLTASWSAARHGFDCAEIGLKQNSWSWTLVQMANLTLSHGWTMNAQYIFCRNNPQLWHTFKDYHFYSFYISKSYLNGRLAFSLVADRPFNKFTPFEADVRTPFHHSFQHNDMRARSIGVKVSYVLSGGKNVNLQRDKSLINDDMETGVK